MSQWRPILPRARDPAPPQTEDPKRKRRGVACEPCRAKRTAVSPHSCPLTCADTGLSAMVYDRFAQRADEDAQSAAIQPSTNQRHDTRLFFGSIRLSQTWLNISEPHLRQQHKHFSTNCGTLQVLYLSCVDMNRVKSCKTPPRRQQFFLQCLKYRVRLSSGSWFNIQSRTPH